MKNPQWNPAARPLSETTSSQEDEADLPTSPLSEVAPPSSAHTSEEETTDDEVDNGDEEAEDNEDWVCYLRYTLYLAYPYKSCNLYF